MIIAWLDKVGSKDTGTVGGKGAQLGEMTRAKFPVPPGFCVTAQAYRTQLESLGLFASIAALLSGANSTYGMAELSAKIRRLIEEQDVLPDIENEIRNAYATLCERGFSRVAVRSSATAEDLPDASFAGQQETFLSIVGSVNVMEAVRRCWASLWTERACAYRAKMGYDHLGVSLAVVVQAMVEADCSGVLFTIDPLASRDYSILINASYGLGESIVSGKVSPDNFLVSKGPGLHVLQSTIGSKETFLRSRTDGKTETCQTPASMRSVACIGKRQLSDLKRLGLAVEAHYGSPQDIEWAFENKRLYLLQARPITTTGSLARGDAGSKQPRSTSPQKKISASARQLMDTLHEHCPDALLPLEFDGIVSIQQQKFDIMSSLGLSLPKASSVLSLDRHGVVAADAYSTRLSFRILLFPFLLKKYLATHTNEWAARSIEPLLARRAEIHALDIEKLDSTALSSHIEETFRIVEAQSAVRFRAHLFPMILLGKILSLRLKLAGLPAGTTETDLLGGLEYKSAKIDGDLYLLAEAVEALPLVKKLLIEAAPERFLETIVSVEGGSAIKTKLESFLKEHGARTPKTFLPFANLSWSECPRDLVVALSAIVRSGISSKRAALVRKSAEKTEAIKRKVRRSLFGGKGFLRSIERYQACFIARELGLYEIESTYVLLRALAAEAGKRLAISGFLPDKTDIRFARMHEAVAALRGKQAADLAEAVARRKAGRARAVSEWGATERETPDAEALTGVPSSAGIYEGPARLVLGTADFSKMEAGDVLVCPYTDPTWTPLFSLAGAVVAESGGPLSHAAIVAREYDIPAVMGVSGALTALSNGQRVRVDGSRGTVRRL
jgi:phosphohistidine swiveling domain-containing protein